MCFLDEAQKQFRKALDEHPVCPAATFCLGALEIRRGRFTKAAKLLRRVLKLDDEWPDGDEVPWCSAFMNYICWLLRLPRSKSLRARSWLSVGTPIDISDARPGFDVVILKRGIGRQPGPDNLTATGHVALFAGLEGDLRHERFVIMAAKELHTQGCPTGFDV